MRTYKFGNITLGGGDNIFRCLSAYILIFLFFFIFYAVRGYSEPIPGYMIFLQFIYFVVYTAMLIGAYKIDIPRRDFYFLVFFYSLFMAFLIRIVSWEFLDEPFLGANDSNTYDNMGKMAIKNDYPYSNYIEAIGEDWGIDDLGMPSVVFLAYKWFGDKIAGQYLLILFNALAITGCTWRLEGIMKFFNIEKKISRFCVAVYAFLPFLSLTAGVGLKENFFLYIIISAFYFMFRFKETKNGIYFIYTSLFIAGALFFRTAVCAMLVLSFIICFISKENNKKRLIRLIFIGFFTGIITINLVLNIIFGLSLEQILYVTQYRFSGETEGSVSSVAWVVQFLSIFFGPFGNFAKTNAYSAAHSCGLIFKGLLGFFLIIGLIKIIRVKLFLYYNLLVYFLMSMAMFLLAGVALDLRYQLTLYPLTLPIIGKVLENNKKYKLFLPYCCLLFIITFFYNQR